MWALQAEKDGDTRKRVKRRRGLPPSADGTAGEGQAHGQAHGRARPGARPMEASSFLESTGHIQLQNCKDTTKAATAV